MKNLIFIGGAQGSGKTTVSLKLTDHLKGSVMLDGDWSAWQGINWHYSKEIIDIQLKNICFTLRNFLEIDDFENIIFCWVLASPEPQQIILDSLKDYDFNFYNISLICDEKTIYNRLLKRELKNYPKQNYQSCKRQIEDVFNRSKSVINLYSQLDTTKINVSNISSEQVMKKILNILNIE